MQNTPPHDALQEPRTISTTSTVPFRVREAASGLPLCFAATPVAVSSCRATGQAPRHASTRDKSTTSALVARQSGKPHCGLPHSKISVARSCKTLRPTTHCTTHSTTRRSNPLPNQSLTHLTRTHRRAVVPACGTHRRIPATPRRASLYRAARVHYRHTQSQIRATPPRTARAPASNSRATQPLAHASKGIAHAHAPFEFFR